MFAEKKARCPSKVYFCGLNYFFVSSLHFKYSIKENKVLISEDRRVGIC